MGSFKILIPNILTFSRLFLGGAIMWLLCTAQEFSALWHYRSAGTLLFVALITDLIDGPIARKLKAATKFGYYSDHIIDFVLLIPIFYVLLEFLGVTFFFLFLILEIAVLYVSYLKISKRLSAKWPNNPGRLSFGFLGGATCATLLLIYTPCWSAFSILIKSALIISLLLRLLSFHQVIEAELFVE